MQFQSKGSCQPSEEGGYRKKITHTSVTSSKKELTVGAMGIYAQGFLKEAMSTWASKRKVGGEVNKV